MSIRIDRWLWAVRLTRTRSAATAACKGGKVSVNGERAKPSTLVAPGDEVEANVASGRRIVEVVEPIGKRVGAGRAAECLVDRTPVVEKPPPVAVRDRGAGRPTKRDRRQLERFRDR